MEDLPDLFPPYFNIISQNFFVGEIEKEGLNDRQI